MYWALVLGFYTLRPCDFHMISEMSSGAATLRKAADSLRCSVSYHNRDHRKLQIGNEIQ